MENIKIKEKIIKRKIIQCSECRGKGFWWKQTCRLELGAVFSEPEKIICPKCQ